MKKLLPLILLFFILSACKDNDKKAEESAKPENGMDAARKFIRAALDGDYTKARSFLVKDSTNMQTIDKYEDYYNNNRTPEDKKAYKEASIRFLNDTHKVNDSVTIIYYSNSYKNKPDSLKVIKINNDWFIDLNFTYQPKDSIPQ